MSAATDARLREVLRRGTRHSTDPSNAPTVSRTLVDWLEGIYPPRCYDVGNETLEQHLQYAGKSSLVQDLKTILEEQRTFSPSGDDADRYPTEAPLDWDEAERAGGDN